MKKALLGMLTIMMLVMSGCGDGSVSVVIEPPTITAYEFTKDTVAEFIDGSVSFFAPDSDIDTMTIVIFNSVGNPIYESETLIDLPGVVEGTIQFPSIDYFTFPSGGYTFTVYVTDFNGLPSNQIVVPFSIP